MAGKAKLLINIRCYLNGQISPEAFAEYLQRLVDEFNVVVPHQSKVLSHAKLEQSCALLPGPPSSDSLHSDPIPLILNGQSVPKAKKQKIAPGVCESAEYDCFRVFSSLTAF